MHTNQTASQAPLQIDSYRITPNYGETLGSRKLLSVVPVGRPTKGKFFRASPDPANAIDVFVLEDKVDSTFHLVSPQVAELLGDLVRATTLHLAIDRADNPFLIPVPFPTENGQRNPWHESLLRAIQVAREQWVRLMADKSVGIYQVYVAQGNLQEPNWPELALEEIVRIAFSGRSIDSMEHPKAQSLLGRI
jgi:hypothetical protein